jgi:hypothetical protein
MLTISVTGGGVTDKKIVVVFGGRVKVIYCVDGLAVDVAYWVSTTKED